ncbi:MAG: hypothetical protein JJ956_16145 [Pseudomonadales bacterium]|nr:hypothetical protein [Pseudomonadales bacterium]
MSDEQYVEGIWACPILGYVQKLVFYVLPPPLTWVQAALEGQMVDRVVN